MNNNITQQTTDLIKQDFELSQINKDGTVTEEQLLDALANDIAYLIENQLEPFLNLMYRLDVDERQIEIALMPGAAEPANILLAKLIIERQKKRIITKMNYKQPIITDKDFQDLKF
ncbi:MAG: hypothetical protein IPL95_17460 [Saprospiraceae bacterium]|nr:hypothetical protein [Saprospiraceae bacterium]